MSMKKTTKSKPNARSIHQCFKWIYILLFYTGCLCFRQRNNTLYLSRLGILYTNIVRFSLVVSFIGGITLKLSDEESAHAMFGHLSPVLKCILTFEVTISSITYLEITILMDINKAAHMHLAEHFQQLDQELERDFPRISWNYHKSVRKYTPLTLYVLVFYFTVSFIYLFNLANCKCDLLTTFLIAVSYASITMAPGTSGFLHIGQMDMLRIRFRLLSKLIRMQFVNNGQSSIQHIVICRLITYYRSYTELILEVNNVFSYVCAVSIFYDFAILTNMVFLLCQKASESRSVVQEYIFIILFMVPRMYKVIMTACYGYIVNKEKRNCAHMIVTYAKYFPHTTQVKETLKAFLHWKMHSNCDLTVGKMIRCNLNIAFMVLNGTANYVIILIQLLFQQNIITNRLKISTAQDVELITTSKLPIKH